MYLSTKTFGHELGLSAAFRQWRATHSHCRFIHGYALAIRLEFEAESLDARNWVMDFGGLKNVKQWLQDHFDHKLLVAEDDPELPILLELEKRGLAEIILVPAVGCEAFAKLIYDYVNKWLGSHPQHSERVYLRSVEVKEHGANSAIYEG